MCHRDLSARKIRKEIAQEVVAGIKEKASAHDDAKATAQRTAGQRVIQKWDCSQIEHEEEEEEDDWQKENQMGRPWAEDEKLEETLEQRRREGSSFVNNCVHPLVVLVSCVFGTCRAFVVLAEVFHTWCPHVYFSCAPVFVCFKGLELLSAQFLPLILM